jgi:acyl-CoA thioester hydrolase
MRERYRVWETVMVHWGDQDPLGHVNNARYFTYCETARFRYFTAIDLDAAREHERQGPVLATAQCDFLRQVRYPSGLEVGARSVKLGRTSFSMEYGLYLAGTEDLAARGTAVVVWLDYAAGRPIPLPPALRERIRSLDGIE